MATSLELEPCIRYTYWAEVRLPPERRLPAGVIPVDAGVTTADPRNVASSRRIGAFSVPAGHAWSCKLGKPIAMRRAGSAVV